MDSNKESAISIAFVQGWDHYCQLVLLIGHVQARLVLERLFSYAVYDLMSHNRVIESIAASAEFNPTNNFNIEGVIVVLGIDVHQLMVRHDLFSSGDNRFPTHELVEIATERVIVRRVH